AERPSGAPPVAAAATRPAAAAGTPPAAAAQTLGEPESAAAIPDGGDAAAAPPARADQPAPGEVMQEIALEGGSGATMETAIVLDGAGDMMSGILAEQAYLARFYPGWRVASQELKTRRGRLYDYLVLEGPGGRRELFFDITDWFGA